MGRSGTFRSPGVPASQRGRGGIVDRREAGMSAAVIEAIGPVDREAEPTPVSPEVTETLHGFGDALVGTITRPLGRTTRTTALVLLNGGMSHRMGPFWLYVRMARRLAAQGYGVVRLDQSGMGDSTLS